MLNEPSSNEGGAGVGKFHITETEGNASDENDMSKVEELLNYNFKNKETHETQIEF